LGEIVEAINEVGGNIADGINNLYEDYTDAKSKRNKYGFIDGVRFLLD
jgi:hypothetical protein